MTTTHSSQENGQVIELRPQKNVCGRVLQSCCHDPKTGFFRDGFCKTMPNDHGSHVACVVVTEEFLKFSQERGNDLSTPRPQWAFPGLVPGDRWCLCALRWVEAYEAGVAPQINLEATHQKMLDYIPLEILEKFHIPSPHEIH